jgi:hypothetical protein
MKEGVRGFLNSLRSQETPLVSSTSVKDPRDKPTQLGKQPIRRQDFRLKEMERRVGVERIKQWRRGELGKSKEVYEKGEAHVPIKREFP